MKTFQNSHDTCLTRVQVAVKVSTCKQIARPEKCASVQEPSCSSRAQLVFLTPVEKLSKIDEFDTSQKPARPASDPVAAGGRVVGCFDAIVKNHREITKNCPCTKMREIFLK